MPALSKSKYYKKEDNAGIKCQYSRQELNLSHPSEPCMQCSGKVEEQERDYAKEKESYYLSDFLQHDHTF